MSIGIHPIAIDANNTDGKCNVVAAWQLLDTNGPIISRSAFTMLTPHAVCANSNILNMQEKLSGPGDTNALFGK